jgi:hypothetical protein
VADDDSKKPAPTAKEYLRRIGMLPQMPGDDPTTQSNIPLGRAIEKPQQKHPSTPSDTPHSGEEQDKIETTIRKYLPEIVAFVLLETLAVPFAHAGAEQMLNGHWERGLIGYLVAAVSALSGLTFHWWKNWFSREIIERRIVPWWPLLLAVLFIYVAGPEIYRRAITSVAPTSSQPSAEEIAKLTAPVRAERDTLKRDLDVVRKELKEVKEALIAKLPPPISLPSLPPPREAPLSGLIPAPRDIPEIASAVIRYQSNLISASGYVIEKSAKIKTVTIETDYSRSSTLGGINNPLIAKFNFDGNFGPYEVFLQNVTPPSSNLGFGFTSTTSTAPGAVIAESGGDFVNIQLSASSYLNSSQHPLDLKVWFYKK